LKLLQRFVHASRDDEEVFCGHVYRSLLIQPMVLGGNHSVK